MNQPFKPLLRSICLMAALLGLQAPVLAEKPDWAGQPGGGKHQRGEERYAQRPDDRRDNDRRDGRRDERRDDDRRDERRGDYRSGTSGPQVDIRIGGYFGDTQRRSVYDHYQGEFRSGHCPPGLAKKRNGCLPPGQARKWALGQPLPRDVVFHDLERGVSVHLGLPPAGYKYVRVASDILLIAIGTGMVVDAIKDLGRQ